MLANMGSWHASTALGGKRIYLGHWNLGSLWNSCSLPMQHLLFPCHSVWWARRCNSHSFKASLTDTSVRGIRFVHRFYTDTENWGWGRLQGRAVKSRGIAKYHCTSLWRKFQPKRGLVGKFSFFNGGYRCGAALWQRCGHGNASSRPARIPSWEAAGVGLGCRAASEAFGTVCAATPPPGWSQAGIRHACATRCLFHPHPLLWNECVQLPQIMTLHDCRHGFANVATVFGSLCLLLPQACCEMPCWVGFFVRIWITKQVAISEQHQKQPL